MQRIVWLLLCSHFCAARLYVGGFPTKDGACFCFERVELDVLPAMEITLGLPKKKAEEEPLFYDSKEWLK